METESIKELKKDLKKLLKKGTTVYASYKHVSKSGMSSSISFYVCKSNKIIKIDYYLSKILGYRIDNNNGGIRIAGGNMNMAFATVHEISKALYNHKSKSPEFYLTSQAI